MYYVTWMHIEPNDFAEYANKIISDIDVIYVDNTCMKKSPMILHNMFKELLVLIISRSMLLMKKAQY